MKALTVSWQRLKHPSFIPHCSETLFLKLQHFFVKWHSWSEASLKRQSLRLSVQLQPKEWSGEKKKKTITAWQLFLTLCGMGWWDKANWSRVKHFVRLFLFFFFLTDSSWQRPRVEKSAVPELPPKWAFQLQKDLKNVSVTRSKCRATFWYTPCIFLTANVVGEEIP